MRHIWLAVLLCLLVSVGYGQNTFPNNVKGNLIVEGYVLPKYAHTYSVGSQLYPYRSIWADSCHFQWITVGGMASARADSLYHHGGPGYLPGDSFVTVKYNATLHASYTFTNGIYGWIHGSADTLGHVFTHYYTASPGPGVEDTAYFWPTADSRYGLGGPSNRWNTGYIRKLWTDKIYGTSGPGIGSPDYVDSIFVTSLMSDGRGTFVLGVNHSDTSTNSNNTDTVGHRLYVWTNPGPAVTDSVLFSGAGDLTYGLGDSIHRWNTGYIYKIWTNKIYGTSGPGAGASNSVDSAFIDHTKGKTADYDSISGFTHNILTVSSWGVTVASVDTQKVQLFGDDSVRVGSYRGDITTPGTVAGGDTFVVKDSLGTDSSKTFVPYDTKDFTDSVNKTFPCNGTGNVLYFILRKGGTTACLKDWNLYVNAERKK